MGETVGRNMYSKLKRVNKTNFAASCWLLISSSPERIQKLSFLLDIRRVIYEAGSIIIIIVIILIHGLGRLTCSGIDALPSFLGASTISSSSRFVVEGVFRESGVVHSFTVVDPVLFVFESHVLYSRDF